MLTAGERLRQNRVFQNITLEQAAKATKIKESFLGAIERNDYTALPSPIYAHWFVTNYAHFLGISNQEIMPLFKRQFDEQKAYDVLPKGFTGSRQMPRRHMRTRRTVVVFSCILLFFVLYLLLQFRTLFLPPSLHIATPKENALVGQDVSITGDTDVEATVYIDGALVGVDQNGIYTKALTLFPGKETISVIARNRFGKETRIDRIVTVKPRT